MKMYNILFINKGLDDGNGPVLDWINFAIRDLTDVKKGLF